MRYVQLSFFSLLILTSGCFEQGLVNNRAPALSEESSSSSSSAPVDPNTLVAAVVAERALNIDTSLNPQYIKTAFADKAYNGRNIQGYGSGENGDTFCLSNEHYAQTNGFDNPTKCRRPLITTSDATPEENVENDMLTFLQDNNLDDAQGLPLVIQALQLSFSHKSADLPDVFSKVDTASLKIQIKTAPIEFDNTRKRLYWDKTKISTFNYNSSGCTPSAPNAVSIDILNDSSLTSCPDGQFAANTCVPRNYHFLSGLWVYERGLSEPFESNSQVPIGPYNGYSAPRELFSSRTKVLASFIFPNKVSNGPSSYAASFLYFPGNLTTPSAVPSPFQLSYGMYRSPDSLPVNESTTLLDSSLSDSAMTIVDGVVNTPMMGKYDNAGNPMTANGGWAKHAIVGICIQGSRKYYSGTQTVDTVVSPRLVSTYPVVHALKYELRKIRAFLK